MDNIKNKKQILLANFAVDLNQKANLMMNIRNIINLSVEALPNSEKVVRICFKQMITDSKYMDNVCVLLTKVFDGEDLDQIAIEYSTLLDQNMKNCTDLTNVVNELIKSTITGIKD